eukprot:jgi/Chrzof1/6568/Cz19g01110.t1
MQGDVTQQAAFLALQGDIVQQILLFGLTLYSALARTAVNYDGAAQGVFPELLGYISLYITQGIVVVSTFVAVTAILKAAVRWIDDWKVRTAPEVWQRRLAAWASRAGLSSRAILQLCESKAALPGLIKLMDADEIFSKLKGRDIPLCDLIRLKWALQQLEAEKRGTISSAQEASRIILAAPHHFNQPVSYIKTSSPGNTRSITMR